jgi:hypothetical protein
VRRIKTASNAFQKVAVFASLIALLETAGFRVRTEDAEEVNTFPDHAFLYI